MRNFVSFFHIFVRISGLEGFFRNRKGYIEPFSLLDGARFLTLNGTLPAFQETTKDPKVEGFKKSAEIGHASSAPL